MGEAVRQEGAGFDDLLSNDTFSVRRWENEHGASYVGVFQASEDPFGASFMREIDSERVVKNTLLRLLEQKFDEGQELSVTPYYCDRVLASLDLMRVDAARLRADGQSEEWHYGEIRTFVERVKRRVARG